MFRWLQTHHQSVTALAAILVSVIALYVAWDQSRVMRAQQHGAVIPILQIDWSVSRDTQDMRLEMNVRNNGVGPALVEAVSLYREGEAHADMSVFMAELPSGAGRAWTSISGRSIGVDEEIRPMELTWRASETDREDITRIVDHIETWHVEICYCSVFGRCWQASARTNERPSPVNQCELNERDVFESLGLAATRGAADE